MKQITKKRVIDYLYITLGALLSAIGCTLFFDRVQMVPGGVTGIAIIVKAMLGIPLWLTNLIINVPLFIIVVLLEGKKTGFRSVYGMASQTFFLWLFAWDLTITDNLFLIALYGGIISGIGYGLVFKGLGNTGGTDFVAIIIKHFKPYAKIGNLLMGIETIIVLCGIYFLNIEQALYALIAVYICSKLIDLVIEGNRFGKVCYIISNRYEAIAHVIMKELGRGVTAYEAMGMYKNENRKVLMVIIDRKQIPRVKEIVYSNDKDAFIFLCDASEVAGNGFCNLEDTMEI